MILGLLYALFLTGSAVLAAVIGVAAAAMVFVPRLRWIAVTTLIGGLAGAAAGIAGFGVLMLLFGERLRDVPLHMFILWAVAGFGWTAAGVAAICGGGTAAFTLGRRVVARLSRARM